MPHGFRCILIGETGRFAAAVQGAGMPHGFRYRLAGIEDA